MAWHLALKAIPWTAILANAPALAESARRLIAASRANRGGAATADTATLASRVEALEQRDRETAELVAQLTAQVAALTIATEVLEARGRGLTIVAGLATILAAAALTAVFLF